MTEAVEEGGGRKEKKEKKNLGGQVSGNRKAGKYITVGVIQQQVCVSVCVCACLI